MWQNNAVVFQTSDNLRGMPMRKCKNAGWLLVAFICCLIYFGTVETLADVTEAKKGQTYTGDYAVVINTSQEKTESSGTLQFTTGGTVAQNDTETSPVAEQSISIEDSPALPAVQSAQTQRAATVFYQIGDVREGYGYPNGSAVEQSYVCIGTGEHCYVWMELELMQAYQKKGVLSTIARDTIQVYEGEPYSVLNELCGGDFPALDGSGRLSIFLETLNTSSGVYMYEPDITAIHLKAPEPAWYTPGQMASYNGLLVHEGQHALLHLMTGFPGDAKWFTEGVSVAAMDYVWGSTDSNGWMHSMQGNEKLQNGASMLYTNYRGPTGLDYGIQYLFVRYMIDQMAKEYAPMKVLPGLYRKSASGKTAQQFLTEFTGVEFSSFVADFYTAIVACEKSGKYGFYMDAVAEDGASVYPRYEGTAGQAVSIEKTGAIIIPLQGGTFTMPTDCGGDIVVRIVGTKTSSAAATLSGQGTEESPYLLHSAQELRYIYKAPKAVYRLENDIQMNGTENFTVPSFRGTLDGNGHTIYGLRRPLVANNKGTIKQLSIIAEFTSDHTGIQGVFANENNGTISYCHVSGNIKGRLLGIATSNPNTLQYSQCAVFGGIAGRNYQGFRIENCTSSVNLAVEASVANCWIGGIAGRTNGTIESCSFNGSIYAQQKNGSQYTMYVGGITGEVLRDNGWFGFVKKSSGYGTVTVTGGTKSVGQICGYSNLLTTEEAVAYYLNGCTWDATKGSQYGTPISVEEENQVKETEVSLSSPTIEKTQLHAVQGAQSFLYTGNVTGGSKKYETTVIHEQLPAGVTRDKMPGEYYYYFSYQGIPMDSLGVYTSTYLVKDKISEKGIIVTVTIEVVSSSDARMYRFSLEKEKNSLTKDVEITVEDTNIDIELPAGTDRTALIPYMEYGYENGCRLHYFDGGIWHEYISTTQSFDFSSTRLFKVVAKDGVTARIYYVNIKNKETTADSGSDMEEPKHEHIVVIDPAIPATCSTEGKSEGIHCKTCGEILVKQQIIPKTAHKAVTDKGYAATCTANGLTDGSHCVDCHTVLKEQEVIPAKGHTPVTDWGYEATCTREGLTNGSHCSSCGAVPTPQYPIAKTDHHVVWESGSEATFWNEGRTASAYCSTCHAVLQASQTIPRRESTGNLNMTSFPMRVKQKTTALRVENMAAGDWIASWVSSNPAVATVNARGLITARKQGTSVIQVTLASGRVLTAQVKVQKKQVKTTKVVANTGTVRLKLRTKVRLTPTAYPLTTQQKITYSSKNKKIAKVNGSGWIQAKKQGQTVVTVKSGSKKTKVKVIVYK